MSKLPLHFTLKATTPFSIAPATLSLQPEESAAVTVSFDPNYRGDQTSHTAKQRCLISYPDIPHKDWLDVTGVIEFPNLVLDANAIDFGCVLMDSMKRVAVQLHNPGTRPVNYSWSWLRQALCDGPGEQSYLCDTQRASHQALTVSYTDSVNAQDSDLCCMMCFADGGDQGSTIKAHKPPTSQLFDILPIEGVLGAGQTEQVDFSFFAYPGVKATATAVCAVTNGPVYEVGTRENCSKLAGSTCTRSECKTAHCLCWHATERTALCFSSCSAVPAVWRVQQHQV